MKKNRYKPNKRKQQTGAILALMVLLTLLLSLASMALIAVGREAQVRTVKNVTELSARYAADAGAERALYVMNKNLEDGKWSSDDLPNYTSESLTACEAEYTVTFNGDLASGYQITSVGKSGLATKTVRVTLELSSPFANDYAVLTKGNLGMKNSSSIKGYNSGDSGETDVPVSIGSLSTKNGSIDLKNGAVVDGDVYVAPGGDPDKVVNVKNDKSVTGEIFIMPIPVTLPDVSPPDYTASKGKISGKNITLIASDSGKYTEIDVSSKGKLEVNGDVVLYITGDVTLNNSADLKVKSGSSLRLYFDGDIEAKNSSSISNDSKIPSVLQLFGTGENQTIDMKNGSDLYAVVYAPDADMIVHNKVDIYGSFIVDSFELKNSGDVYYDKALKDISIDGESVHFTITRWEEL